MRLLATTAVLAAILGSAGALGSAGPAAAETTLNVITGGDQNMVEYVTDYLGPLFEKAHPGVKVRVTGTGPGDAGSQKIGEKLEAQAGAGSAAWDTDVVVVTQKKAGELVQKGLVAKYRGDIDTGKLVTSEAAVNALGTDVDGFVMPMFQSQTAIAYNSDMVKTPPASYDELKAWAAANPKQFGTNGIKNGMSGVSFVVGWIYAYGGDAQKLMKGPYDKAAEEGWAKAFADLKEFNRNVTFTAGNAGTLDMLSRGEIAMGPVWVDMFYSWTADGRLPPSMKLKLIAPGMPGQPYYYAIPAKAANQQAARDFIALATSPAVQAEGIVKRFNWYPGIDPVHIEKELDKASWDKLFVDVTPKDLADYGRTFPLASYLTDITETYEKTVGN